VFEGAIIAEALHEYFGGGSMKIWYLVVIAAAVPLVLGGVRVWLDRFNGYLFPIYLVGIVATLIWIGIEHGASLAIADPGLELGAPGWLWTTTVYMGVFILMLVTVDFARFGKVSDAKYHGLVTFGPVFYLLLILVNGLVGIFITASGVLGSAVSEGGIAAAIVGTMGIVGLLFIVVSQSRANTANLYLASTNTEMVFSKLLRIRQPRIVWTLVAAAIAYAIMLTDIFSYILRALNWQGVFVVGWVGIVLVHIFVHRHQSGFEFRAGRLKAVSPAVAVWVISAVVGITMIEAGGTTGATWAPPATFLVSAIGYALVSRWDAILHRPHDPQHEVDDVWDARIKCHVCDLSYVAVEMDRDPSADLQAICSECSDNSAAFLSAAKRESS
jgi:purine-cytosine permease-like protein